MRPPATFSGAGLSYNDHETDHDIWGCRSELHRPPAIFGGAGLSYIDHETNHHIWGCRSELHRPPAMFGGAGLKTHGLSARQTSKHLFHPSQTPTTPWSSFIRVMVLLECRNHVPMLHVSIQHIPKPHYN